MTATPAPQPAAPADDAPSAGYRAYVLFALIIVYTFNFIDRQIMGILSIPIQAELQVSDTQMSLMRGVAFALFYSTLGVPVAWLADRTNRVWIITIALTAWSGMTAVCGVAQNAWQLFLARMGVGVGEAGGVSPAYSIVSDYFPPHQRARALAIYSFGVPIGSAVGIIFGGVIAAAIDWRAAFIIIGIAGVLFAPIFRLTVREPRRGRFDGAHANVKPASISEVVETLLQKRSFWFLCVGAACSSMMGYGLFAWMPAFLFRSFPEALPAFFTWLPEFLTPRAGANVSPEDAAVRVLTLYAAYFYGAVVFVGGVIGIYVGGVLADKLGAKDRAAYARLPAIGFLAVAPLFIAGVLSPSLSLTFFALLIPTALGLAWLGPVLSAFQHIVPPNMRATASAVFLLINNLIGIALGDLILGLLSDGLRAVFGDESLRYALMSGGIFYILAAAFLWLGSRHLAADWEA